MRSSAPRNEQEANLWENLDAQLDKIAQAVDELDKIALRGALIVSPGDIAEYIQIHVDTIKSRLFRGL